MDHFRYENGALMCENVAATDIASTAGTPVYVYSKATILEHYTRLTEAFAALDPLVCYSIKSNSNLSICRLLGEQGAGMDLVSGGELYRARLAGVEPADCVFAGVGKTDLEIEDAIRAGVGWLNVESEAEFENIAAIAARIGKPCRVALRVNPDVDPKTHRYTTTGTRETKFGVDIERARQFFATYGGNDACIIDGIHIHLGSPIYDTEPYVRSIGRIVELMDDLASKGHQVNMLDIGGGFGADYVTDQTPRLSLYAEAITPLLESRVRDGLRVVLEPGRTIMANAGVLLLGIQYMKISGDKTFAICDGGMNILLRPSHYDAFHFIWPAEVGDAFVPTRRDEEMEMDGLRPVDVVGPICETGDFLAIDRPLPPLKRGDVLAVFGAGAYGMSMASHYNTHPLPAEILVDGDALLECRARERYEDLVAHELEPRPIAMST